MRVLLVHGDLPAGVSARVLVQPPCNQLHARVGGNQKWIDAQKFCSRSLLPVFGRTPFCHSRQYPRAQAHGPGTVEYYLQRIDTGLRLIVNGECANLKICR
jgi:hypothetical protein